MARGGGKKNRRRGEIPAEEAKNVTSEEQKEKLGGIFVPKATSGGKPFSIGSDASERSRTHTKKRPLAWASGKPRVTLEEQRGCGA